MWTLNLMAHWRSDCIGVGTGVWQCVILPYIGYIYIYIYIYIKWPAFVNVTTKSVQHAHARMIAIIVEKSPIPSHL